LWCENISKIQIFLHCVAKIFHKSQTLTPGLEYTTSFFMNNVAGSQKVVVNARPAVISRVSTQLVSLLSIHRCYMQ
jgi:hypothetical protein